KILLSHHFLSHSSLSLSQTLSDPVFLYLSFSYHPLSIPLFRILSFSFFLIFCPSFFLSPSFIFPHLFSSFLIFSHLSHSRFLSHIFSLIFFLLFSLTRSKHLALLT